MAPASPRALDRLETEPHPTYAEYLRTVVYPAMARYTLPTDRVMEVGVRPEAWCRKHHLWPPDRGVLSPPIIPHRTYTLVDKDPGRGPDIVADVRTKVLRADVILSTCLLHHLAKAEVPLALAHLHARVLMFSGPNAAVNDVLYGDHRWHLEADYLEALLHGLGYAVRVARTGMSEPLAEMLVVGVLE